MEYKYTGEKHRCSCCGEEHEGNYCPLCGQKASQGPVTWKSMWAGIMEIWGMHSRSLPYTAWQLLFRPGHLMRDYVTGKRQISFPPVKMLVVLGVVVYLLGHWLSPKDYTHEIGKITATGFFYYINYAWNWLQKHDEWVTLITFSALILPTWYVFRHAPLLKRHTLPQGFFIQVFVANQSLILELIILLLALMMFFVPYQQIKYILVIILPLYLCIDYKQLFGYSWWGTLWRLLMMLVICLLFSLAVGSVIGIVNASITFTSLVEFMAIITITVFFFWLTYIAIHFIDVINRKAWLEQGKWAVIKRPLIITIATILVLVVVTSIASTQ